MILVDLGFKHCQSDHSVYCRFNTGGKLIIAIHVDDMALFGNSVDQVIRIKKELQSFLEVSDLGEQIKRVFQIAGQ